MQGQAAALRGERYVSTESARRRYLERKKREAAMPVPAFEDRRCKCGKLPHLGACVEAAPVAAAPGKPAERFPLADHPFFFVRIGE